MASIYFALNYSGNYQIYARGHFQWFTQRAVEFIPILLAIYFIFHFSQTKFFRSYLISYSLFFASIFSVSRFNIQSLKSVALFSLGLIPIPVITRLLVIIQPGGLAAFNRAFEYLKNGAPMLSGQALNLDWFVTYFLHLLQPSIFESIEYLGGLNRQIPSDYAPFIFRGFLFITAFVVIFSRYWLFQKKNLITFLSASTMIFFSHHILNKSAYEKHLFYTVILMLFLYLIRPTDGNKKLLILFDIMTVMNLILFYGFTGPKDISHLVFGFDITVIFSAFYVVIYFWVMYRYIYIYSKKICCFRLIKKLF